MLYLMELKNDKSKVTKQAFIECNTCSNSIEVKSELHCATRIKDINDIRKYSAVSIVKECSMFKIKK